MVRWVVGSIPHGVPISTIPHSSQCSATGVTEAVVCAILSVGWLHIKKTLLLIEKSNPCSGRSGFSLSLSEWSFTICPTPYNCK